MNRWPRLFSGIILGTLCACAPMQTGIGSPDGTPTTARATPELTCAIIDDTDAMTLSYPAGSIYNNGAVLPKKEGLACLENLADWLRSSQQRVWLVTVSGEAGQGFDPLALAEKRQELLQRFFDRKGLMLKEWYWKTVAGQEVQMKLVEVKN